MSRAKREYPFDRLLSECREPSASVQHLPGPLSERVDQLVERIRTEGTVPRWELVSALILAAPEDPKYLSEILRKFREATVRDALVGVAPSDSVLVLDTHRPGHRPATRK